MADHSSLTGSELHECKGANTALINTVRVSDGAGSGAWQKIGSASIDTSSIKTINKAWDFFVHGNPTTPSAKVYVPIDQNKILVDVKVIVNNTVAGTLICTVKKNAGTVGTNTIASTTEGSTMTVSVATPFTASDSLVLEWSGTSTSSFTVLLSYTF